MRPCYSKDCNRKTDNHYIFCWRCRVKDEQRVKLQAQKQAQEKKNKEHLKKMGKINPITNYFKKKEKK